MFIFDAHLDLGWNALSWNRDITQPVPEVRSREAGMTELGRGTNTVALPEMRRGRVGLCLATALARWNPAGDTILDFRSQRIAEAAALAHICYYELLERDGAVRIVRDAGALNECARLWSDQEYAGAIGIILSMEGADPIASPEELPRWFERGLRVIEPVHYGQGAYACGTGVPGGLTEKGPGLLRAMDEVGMVLDVTHLADEAMTQALDIFEGPVLASHHNCRALVPGQRQLSDPQIRSLVARQAVIGIALDAWMLSPNGWERGKSSNSAITLSNAVDHIDHICAIAGNTEQVGIGSDLDGGFGTEQSPCDLDTIADLRRFEDLLSERGYADTSVRQILNENWLEFFRRAWSAR